MKKDVRATHFNLGNTKTSYISHAGNTMIEPPITQESVIAAELKRKDQIDRMRKANFRLPNQRELITGESIQKSNLVDHTGHKKVQMLTNLKHSSIKIGLENSKLEDATEFAQQFQAPQMNKVSTNQNQDMKKYLKGHHFDLGSKSAKMSV